MPGRQRAAGQAVRLQLRRQHRLVEALTERPVKFRQSLEEIRAYAHPPPVVVRIVLAVFLCLPESRLDSICGLRLNRHGRLDKLPLKVKRNPILIATFTTCTAICVS